MARQTRSRKDAVALLKADHRKVQKMFKEFEGLEDDADDEKAQLVKQVCTELTVHAQVEEEIFYPAVREALGEDEQDLMDEAEVEHASAKALIGQLQNMQPGDELYDAKVTVLGEYINHHVKEEQNEMFPKAKKSGVDLKSLGEQIMNRKQELMPAAAEDNESEPMEESARSAVGRA